MEVTAKGGTLPPEWTLTVGQCGDDEEISYAVVADQMGGPHMASLRGGQLTTDSLGDDPEVFSAKVMMDADGGVDMILAGVPPRVVMRLGVCDGGRFITNLLREREDTVNPWAISVSPDEAVVSMTKDSLVAVRQHDRKDPDAPQVVTFQLPESSADGGLTRIVAEVAPGQLGPIRIEDFRKTRVQTVTILDEQIELTSRDRGHNCRVVVHDIDVDDEGTRWVAERSQVNGPFVETRLEERHRPHGPEPATTRVIETSQGIETPLGTVRLPNLVPTPAHTEEIPPYQEGVDELGRLTWQCNPNGLLILDPPYGMKYLTFDPTREATLRCGLSQVLVGLRSTSDLDSNPPEVNIRTGYRQTGVSE